VAPIEKRQSITEIAAVISDALTKAGLNAVLSGGSVVSIYSDNEYESYDLDFVTDETIKDVTKVMNKLGFVKKSTRHFEHDNSRYMVEFPPAPLAIGNEPVRDWAELRTKHGTIQILTPTQCVMDRLAAFYHWNDRQGLDQAVMVAKRQEVDLEKVKKWSKEEGHFPKFEEFVTALKGSGS
jgi:hypothetical protein